VLRNADFFFGGMGIDKRVAGSLGFFTWGWASWSFSSSSTSSKAARMSVRLWVGANKQGYSSKRMDSTSARGRTFNVEGKRLSIVGGFCDADAPWAVLAFEHVSPLGWKRLRGISTLDHGGCELNWTCRTCVIRLGVDRLRGRTMLRTALREDVRDYNGQIRCEGQRGDPGGQRPLLAGPGADKEKDGME
jgi:hypothetical protein